MIVFLTGSIGSGKTCFAQGVAHALGVAVPVTSPSFTIVNEYETQPPFLHVDLYRIGSPDEYELLGLDERYSDSISLMEWPERAGGLAPHPDFTVLLTIMSPHKRRIEIRNTGESQRL